MEKEFVPYEQALTLKQLGFNEPCFGFWTSKNSYRRFVNDSSTNIDLKNMFGEEATEAPTAPLYQQVFRWFREKYNLHSEIQPIFKSELILNYYRIRINDTTKFELGRPVTYEEAELECLKKLIEIAKNKL